jgi:flagellar hook-length control protein FliK
VAAAANTDDSAPANSATTSATAPASKKPASDGSGADQSEASDSATSDAGQAPASNSSPVAAVIALNDALGATPAASESGPNLAIGEQTRARASLSRAGQANQPAIQFATAGADAKSSAPADSSAATPSADKAAATGGSQSQSSSPDSSGRTGAAGVTQTDGIVFTAPPGNADAQTTANLVTAHTTAAASGDGAANAQIATDTVKAAGANLPSFGLVAANSAAPQAAAATSATAAASVPVSGLPIAIAARALAGSNQFDIRLDPPELGRIDVRLDVDANGQVTSHVTVDRPETLTLLQSQQPQLERALEQAGLKTADNGLQFTLRDQSFSGGNTGSGGGTQPNAAQQLVIPDSDLPSVDATQIYSRWGLGGGVDITV